MQTESTPTHGRAAQIGAELHALVFGIVPRFNTKSTAQGHLATKYAPSFTGGRGDSEHSSGRNPASLRKEANIRRGSDDLSDDAADRRDHKHSTDRKLASHFGVGEAVETHDQYRIRMAPTLHCCGNREYVESAARNRARIARLQKQEAYGAYVQQTLLNRKRA